jgi:hypothetical protein
MRARAFHLPLLIALAAGACAQSGLPSSPDAESATGVMSGPPSAPSEIARPPAGMSRQDDCRGPAELCKQDSAR